MCNDAINLSGKIAGSAKKPQQEQDLTNVKNFRQKVGTEKDSHVKRGWEVG